uniref:Uncharacterized protein n=1 Tax=Anopheles atroparvus TaxID=41427 RepID=A0A182IQ36_ANOAO
MVASSSAASGRTGKNGSNTINSGNDPAKRNVQSIATANCASNSAAAASGDHRSQRGVVNCFLRFIFLRNIFILLIVVSSLLVSTTDAVISSREYGKLRIQKGDTKGHCFRTFSLQAVKSKPGLDYFLETTKLKA